MAGDQRGGGISAAVNHWVQTLAIVAAGLWAVYTFVYLEIAKPASAPINLSTQIVMRKAGTGAEADGAKQIAVELNIAATNPSSRTVFILSNYWRVMGYRVLPRPANFDWRKNANDSLQTRTQTGAAEHYVLSEGALAAFGSVLPDDQLKPGESISRSYVFYVPEGAYDMLDVETVLPSVSKPNLVDAVWDVHPDGYIDLKVYKTGEGRREELPRRKDGSVAVPDLDLQTAQSRRQLSLWEERKAP